MGLIDHFIKQHIKNGHLSHAHTIEKGVPPSFYINMPTSVPLSSRAQVTSGQNKSSLQKCLNHPCKHSRRKIIDGNIVAWPWCGRQNKPVIDIQTCPLSLWTKDEKGFPIPKHRRQKQ